MNETHATPVNGTLSTNDKQATFQQHNSNINLASYWDTVGWATGRTSRAM